MTDKKTINPFTDLDLATLESWTGAKTISKGREYQRKGRVTSLACSHDGSLVAWVTGSEQYATIVTNKNGLDSACTCPVRQSCKHAVAVVLEYFAFREKAVPVPSLAPDDPRIALLDDLFPDAFPGENKDVEDNRLQMSRSHHPDPDPCGIKRPHSPLRHYLDTMKKKELLDLMEELMEQFPEVGQEISDRRSLAEGDPLPIFDELVANIECITEEEAWSDDWSDDSHIPDYSPVRKRMEMLLAMDQPDLVVEAGKTLIRKGKKQLENGDDRTGEVSDEIDSCLVLVFTALRRSGRPVFERLLFAIHATFDDDFGLCADAWDFLKEDWPAVDWSRVADSLLADLGTYKIPLGHHDSALPYWRDRFTSCIGTALDKAGREEEATALYRDEIAVTGSYLRLASRLHGLKRDDEAVAWIRQGILAVKKIHPGTAGMLQDLQREIWEKEGNHLAVAGLRAEDFLTNPSYHSYTLLKTAAKDAGAWDMVKDTVMQYLVSGGSHAVMEEDGGGQRIIFKVLPASGFLDPDSWRVQPEPFYSILIEKTLVDRQPEDAVMWFDRSRNDTTRPWGPAYPPNKLWDAVAERFPDRALQYWMESAERNIRATTPKGYEGGIGYLKKIRMLLEDQGRTAEWLPYLAEIRSTHARKKKFMAMLDLLEGKKILQAGTNEWTC